MPWWLPGFGVLVLGSLLLVGGLFSGGPDVVDGIVFGGGLLFAGSVILWRRGKQRNG